MSKECCSVKQNTPFCAYCGKEIAHPTPLHTLLRHCQVHVRQCHEQAEAVDTSIRYRNFSEAQKAKCRTARLRPIEKWQGWVDALEAVIGANGANGADGGGPPQE